VGWAGANYFKHIGPGKSVLCDLQQQHDEEQVQFSDVAIVLPGKGYVDGHAC